MANCEDCENCKRRSRETGRPHPALMFTEHPDILALAEQMRAHYPELGRMKSKE